MIPRATYRLQFHKGFPFAAAIPLASYFSQVGISHLYSSPILKSRAGSRHGYDVIDHGIIDPELGGEDGFCRLAATLREHKLGIVLDIVPNHMAVHNDNHWWMDVLEHGQTSPYSHYFDIDWEMNGGKVLAAFLGQPYWRAIDAGEIKVAKDAQEKHFISYFDWRFPIRAEDQGEAELASSSVETLHSLLERQHYRLAWWRSANDEINWRRFFDIPDLIALNQNRDDVFEATHAKVFALFADGLIEGVRVDHIDGLSDPAAYCRRLGARLEEIAEIKGHAERPYIVVEKILGADEELPLDWRVDGTTGYDFMNDVSALQHDRRSAAPLAQAWHRISGRSPKFEDEERLARSEIVHKSFESALSSTSEAFGQVAPAAGATSAPHHYAGRSSSFCNSSASTARTRLDILARRTQESLLNAPRT
jgi:(1->4)-alpha-D-glucan 1-alpha-D-glucosylmutase